MQKQSKHFRKREAILSCLRGTDCHPGAEWIHGQLKPAFPDLSLGTVYRNLSLFKEQGLIASVGTVAGVERFDGNTETHSHFVCDCCGAVIDLPEINLDETINQSVETKYHLAVGRHELTFHGTCQTCIH